MDFYLNIIKPRRQRVSHTPRPRMDQAIIFRIGRVHRLKLRTKIREDFTIRLKAPTELGGRLVSIDSESRSSVRGCFLIM